MPAFLVGLILYMFSYEVVAKMLVILFKRLADATTWTEVDNDLVRVLEERFPVSTSNDKP